MIYNPFISIKGIVHNCSPGIERQSQTRKCTMIDLNKMEERYQEFKGFVDIF